MGGGEVNDLGEIQAKLTRKFSNLSLLEYTDEYPGIQVFERMAAECIRQMEWARRPEREMEVIEVWGKGGNRHPNIVRNLPLTLAPDDWKPE